MAELPTNDGLSTSQFPETGAVELVEALKEEAATADETEVVLRIGRIVLTVAFP